MHSNDEGTGSERVGFAHARVASQPSGMDAVEALTDDDLLAGTRRLVCQSNRVLAALLAHLAEVEARGLHRKRACASLYIYCIYELRMSEDAAYRRVAAARLVKRFPLLFGAVERGELHLTALLLLAPYLTEANLVEVLARAKFRTKKEIMKLVRLLSPLPDVPSRIEPLGLERRPVPRATWGNLMTARHPVRELLPDERPGNWLPQSEETEGFAVSDDVAVVEPALARNEPTASPDPIDEPGQTSTRIQETESALDGPQRFKVQFTASEDYVVLVEEAKALLAHALPRADIAEIHLRAMQTLVAELKKRKYATSSRRAKSPVDGTPTDLESSKTDALPPATALSDATVGSESPRQRGRHVPAAVRRAVFERDGNRCAYVDARGERCRESSRLEFHHHDPFARGGPPTLENLSLYCAAHNALEAERDFGREHAQAKRSEHSHLTERTVSRGATPDG